MSKSLDSNPRRDGYRMPGEFEPHSGCWLLWPERPDNWRLGAKPAQQAFVRLATAIAGSEPGFGALVNTHWEPVKQRMTDLIAAGIRSGQLRQDTDPDAIIRLLVGPLLMTPLFTQAGATQEEIDQTTDAILRAFLARP